MKKINNDFLISKLNAYLTTINKDTNFLLEKCGIDIVTYRNWVNNHKSISLDFLNMIALFLKSYQCNIYSPKQLMNDDMSFDVSGQKSVRTNIRYLVNLYAIDSTQIYEGKFGLAKNTVSRILRGVNEPSFDVLINFFNFLKTKKAMNLQSHLDLIYFPSWGENEKSYIELRNKLKVLI